MNKEHFYERVTAIKQEMEVVKSRYVQLEGHLNEVMHWISELEKPVSDDNVNQDATIDSCIE